MGRPINKKFFGNLNNPYNRVPQNDTGTGGENLASVTVTSPGSYTVIPTVNVGTPELNVESNTPAVAQVGTMKSVSAAVSANGTGYNYGQTLSVNAGTYSTTATYTVAAITAVGFTVAAYYDGVHGYADGDTLTYSTGMVPSYPIVVVVKRRSGDPVNGTVIAGLGAPTGFVITSGGRRAATAPGNPFAYDPNGLGGQGASLNFIWGVFSLSATPAVAGSYTALGSNPVALSGGTGTGAQANIAYGVNTIIVDNAGSGYITAPSVTFAPTGAGATAVLTTTANTSLAVKAWVPQLSDNTANSSGSAIYGDIVKQEGSHRYYIDSNQGHGVCKLVAKATGSLAIGEMNLIATDYNGNTYYVTKLTNRLATLTQIAGGSNYVYNTEDRARWTIGSAVGTNKLLSTTKVSIASD
jgi:hypothetical protein